MKKTVSLWALLLTILFSFSNGFAVPKPADGKEVYERKCARCHGDDGTPKKRGVPNLKKSDLTDAQAIDIITNGEDKMPAFGKRLSAEEIKAVAMYVKGFRK